MPLAGSPPTVLLGFLKEFIYFVFGGAGSSLLRGLLSSCGEHGATLQLWRLAFSLRWPHLYDMGSGARRLRSCSSRAMKHRRDGCDSCAQLFHGTWDLPRSGIEPVSPALAGGSPSTAPPGKSGFLVFEVLSAFSQGIHTHTLTQAP